MAALYKPRVKETTNSTGTGNIQLLGAPVGYQTFLNAFGTGAECLYAIFSATQWECGLGIISASGILSRLKVIRGSSGDLVTVNFSAGAKTVICAAIPEAANANQAQQLAANSATPDVRLGRVFRVANGSPTTITAFPGGVDGQVITLIFENGNTTIDQGTGMRLAGGVDFVGTTNDTLTLVHHDGDWYEKSRSVNA